MYYKIRTENRVNYVMWFILQERWYCILWLSDVELSLQQGVYLYLGYSQKDEALLKKVTKQGALEAIGAIQGLVAYHNVNSNKVCSFPSLSFNPLAFWFKLHLSLQSECRILLSKHSGENIVLQAVMDEFEENREKGNLTAELLNREKVR